MLAAAFAGMESRFGLCLQAAGKQISVSSVGQLHPRLSRYVPTTFVFIYTLLLYKYSDSRLSQGESSCTFTLQDEYQ
jgi:hypothetical protein